MLCAPVTPSVTAVTRERGRASSSPGHPHPGAAPAGKSRQPQPRPARRRRIRVCLHKMEFYKIPKIQIPPLHIKPGAAPPVHGDVRAGWVGGWEMGPHPPRSDSPNSGPPRAGRGPGDKGRAGRAQHGWMEGKESASFPMDRECRQGSAPPAPRGGDKGDKGDPMGPGAPSPGEGQSSAAPKALQALELFPFAGFGSVRFYFFPLEVSRGFTLTTKGGDFIHRLESRGSGKGNQGDL